MGYETGAVKYFIGMLTSGWGLITAYLYADGLLHPMDYVEGYTCVNDITAIDWGGRENYGVRTKGMDTFCPTGPVLDTDVGDTNPERDVTVRVNGDLVADSNTDMMIFSVTELISHVSKYMTLEPGDVIASGAPPENRNLTPGDNVEIEVEGVGSLENPVES